MLRYLTTVIDEDGVRVTVLVSEIPPGDDDTTEKEQDGVRDAAIEIVPVGDGTRVTEPVVYCKFVGVGDCRSDPVVEDDGVRALEVLCVAVNVDENDGGTLGCRVCEGEGTMYTITTLPLPPRQLPTCPPTPMLLAAS